MDKKMTFEQAMERLEKIVSELESGKCTLDRSLELFEEGTKLTAFCSAELKAAEQKIMKLTDTDGGEFTDRQGEGMGEVLS